MDRYCNKIINLSLYSKIYTGFQMYKFISSPEYESTIVADIPDSNYLCYIYGHSMSVSIDSGALWIFGLRDYTNIDPSNRIPSSKFKIAGSDAPKVELEKSTKDDNMKVTITGYKYPVAILLNVNFLAI